MNKRTLDDNVPVGKVTVVKDFLPPPSQLTARKKHVRVTLELTEESVTFFKEEATKSDGTYQTMIRTLVDEYASHWKKGNHQPHV
jgi:predicted DNA binding CopG/RHH family protein